MGTTSNPTFEDYSCSLLFSQVFDLHLRGRNHSHPFFRNVVVWSINDPHFMSAKLLSASGWDDILESGELSPWTSRQRLVSVKILRDTIINEPEVLDKPATVGAIQALLGFEVRAPILSRNAVFSHVPYHETESNSHHLVSNWQ